MKIETKEATCPELHEHEYDDYVQLIPFLINHAFGPKWTVSYASSQSSLSFKGEWYPNPETPFLTVVSPISSMRYEH